jgi:hypothetical protein
VEWGEFWRWALGRSMGFEMGLIVARCVCRSDKTIARFWLLGVGVWGVLISEYMFT